MNKPIIAIVAAMWIASSDSVEEYERFVEESTGKVLVMVMHAKQTTNPWGVYKNGAGFGEYITKEQAKTAAEKLVKDNDEHYK
jgi:hypothetical protein